MGGWGWVDLEGRGAGGSWGRGGWRTIGAEWLHGACQHRCTLQALPGWARLLPHRLCPGLHLPQFPGPPGRPAQDLNLAASSSWGHQRWALAAGGGWERQRTNLLSKSVGAWGSWVLAPRGHSFQPPQPGCRSSPSAPGSPPSTATTGLSASPAASAAPPAPAASGPHVGVAPAGSGHRPSPSPPQGCRPGVQ